MKFDTVIIGGGLAGMVAGITLEKAGKKTAIISTGQNALHFFSGSFESLQEPEQRIVDLFSEAGVRLHYSPGVRLMPLGTFRPAALSLEDVSLFEDPGQIEAELSRISDVLFPYTTGNVVEFTAEVNGIDDKAQLYELRAALKRYRELRNVAQMMGYQKLYERFDLSKARELLHEVDNRIKLINYKEAMRLQDMSTGAVNVLLDQIEFSFRNVGESELAVADEFSDRLRKTYAAFAANRDPHDPEYVNLLDELKKKLSKKDIEDMTTDDMVASIDELKSLKKRMDELNRRDEQLAKKYDGDTKFMRVHKKALRTPPPLTTSPAKLFVVLSRVKGAVDDEVMHNEHVLDNQPLFTKKVRQLVLVSCDTSRVEGAMDTVDRVADDISHEYFEEKRKVS